MAKDSNGADWSAIAARAAAADELLVLVGCVVATDEKGHARIQRGDSVPPDQLGLRRLEAGDRLKAGELPAFAVASLAANRCAVAVQDAEAAHAALVAEYGPLQVTRLPDGGSVSVGIPPLAARPAPGAIKKE